MPSRIKKYNFCCSEHRALYQKSPENKDFGKGWKHTAEEIAKIRQANLNRDYSQTFTEEERAKAAKRARNKVWTPEARKNASLSHLGKKLPEEQKRKIRENSPKGEENKQWKDDDASYAAKHSWAKRHMEKPKVCAFSQTEGHLCKGRLELANKNHQYERNIDDWAWMCRYHHDKFDVENGLRRLTPKTVKIYGKFINPKVKNLSISGIVDNPTISPNLNYQ